MSRGGANLSKQSRLSALLSELHKVDCRIEDEKIRELVSFGPQIIPHLEAILTQAIEQNSRVNIKSPQRDSDWFVAIHALYLLAEVRSEASLPLVLRFLAQKQDVLDYWLHELLDEDIWEVLFFLGQDRLSELREFLLNQQHNVFSRLAVATALAQIALHHPDKTPEIANIFADVLELNDEDPDFTGLLVSELLDLKEESLKPAIMRAIDENEVWEGIITVEEVERCYQSEQIRKLKPLGMIERYQLFRKYTNFTTTSPAELSKTLKRRNLQNFT